MYEMLLLHEKVFHSGIFKRLCRMVAVELKMCVVGWLDKIGMSMPKVVKRIICLQPICRGPFVGTQYLGVLLSLSREQICLGRFDRPFCWG